MEVHLRITPSARKNTIVKEGDIYRVHLTAPAQDGKANLLLIKLIAEHFGVRRRQVEITKGLKSRNKIINIYEISN